MEPISNLGSEPPWFTPPGSATSTQPPHPILDGLPAGLEHLFFPSHKQHGPGTLAARTQCRAITEQVAATLHVNCDVLLSPNRRQHVAFCRQVAMYLCRQLTAGSWHTLGAYFGRDHSTVIHACKVIQRRMDDPVSGPVFARLIARLAQPITATTSILHWRYCSAELCQSETGRKSA